MTNNDDGIRYHEVKKEDCSNNSDEPIDGDPNYSTSPSPLTITPITNPIIFDIPSYECPCHHTHYLENPLIRGYFHTQDEVPSSNSNPIRVGFIILMNILLLLLFILFIYLLSFIY